MAAACAQKLPIHIACSQNLQRFRPPAAHACTSNSNACPVHACYTLPVALTHNKLITMRSPWQVHVKSTLHLHISTTSAHLFHDLLHRNVAIVLDAWQKADQSSGVAPVYAIWLLPFLTLLSLLLLPCSMLGIIRLAWRGFACRTTDSDSSVLYCVEWSEERAQTSCPGGPVCGNSRMQPLTSSLGPCE